jgi:hypothetical protein
MSPSIDSTDGNVLARFEKNSKEEVRVSVDTFHGRQIINLRVFYRDGDEWKHGKQGIALSVERFKDLADAVLQVGQYLKTQGIL